MPEGAERLRQLTLSGAGWNVSSKAALALSQLAVTMVLARQLGPETFGVVAQVTIVTGFVASVSQAGMASAVVQHRHLTDQQTRFAFTWSVAVAAALTVAMWAMADRVGLLLQSAQFPSLFRVLACGLVLTGIGSTAWALLTRALRYRVLVIVELVSYVLGYGAIGITLALRGHGAWSLVAATLSQTAIRSLVLLAVTRHSVRPSWDYESARDLIRFGAGSTLTRVFNYGATHGDYAVIAGRLGAEALGLYSRAYQLMIAPIVYVSGALSAVLFPAFAEVQNEPARLRRGYLAAAVTTALVVGPACAWLAAASEDVLVVLFGAAWAPGATALQILAVGGYFRAIYNLNDSAIRAKGAVYRQAGAHFVYAVAVVVGGIIGSRWGIEGVATGVLVALLLMYSLSCRLVLRLLDLRWKDFLLAQSGALAMMLVIGVVSRLIVTEHLFSDRVFRLALSVIASGGLAAAAVGLNLVRLPVQVEAAIPRRFRPRSLESRPPRSESPWRM